MKTLNFLGILLIISLTLTLFLAPIEKTELQEAQAVTLSQGNSTTEIVSNLVDSQSKNVVLILADDLDWETFNEISKLNQLKKESVTFVNHTVTDSLCCPSRASILTGKYVKNHKIYSNVKETGGGWYHFKKRKLHKNNIVNFIKEQNPAIRTLFVGKYLNQYTETSKMKDWDSFITPLTPKQAYEGYNYVLSVNGKTKKYGNTDKDYLNTVLTNKAVNQINKNSDQQFMLMYSSFLPHSPYEARRDNKGLYADKNQVNTSPGFNITPRNSPTWLQSYESLTNAKISKLQKVKQKRLESTYTLAEDIEKIIEALQENNIDDKTVIIVTSDNGYHLGQRKLPAGKRTPYYHDTVVPLLIIDPSVKGKRTEQRITSSVDLTPTILDYLDLEKEKTVDGTSLKPLVTGSETQKWRNWVLTEANAKSTINDPDYTKYAPETFKAIRSTKWLYIVYSSGEKEIYDLEVDPYEMNNIAQQLPYKVTTALHEKWQKLVLCQEEDCIVY